MEPEILSQSIGIQASYNVPHRINDTALYPRKSQNGHSIIVYGHNDGVRIIWYTGQHSSVKEHASADGVPTNQQDNLDNTQTNTYIHGHRDVVTGSPVLHISFAPLPQDRSRDQELQIPSIFGSHILIAAACANSSLQLIALPLDLQEEEDKEEAQLLTIPCAEAHQDLISSVSLTWTGHEADVSENSDTRSRSRSRNRERPTSGINFRETKAWFLLLASSSPSGSGLIMFHQIPLAKEGPTLISSYSVLSRQPLRCPVERGKVSFNPSIYPSPKHLSLLLTCPMMGTVKILDTIISDGRAKRREDSTVTDSSGTNSSVFVSKASVKCRISLHSGFAALESAPTLPRRKTILDAVWILKGRAILVLQGDGEWGIWDVEAAGPASSGTSQKLLKEQSDISGIQGGAISRLVCRGKIEDVIENREISQASMVRGTKSSSLAPMTPHTRKSKSNGLFHGSVSSSRQAAASTQPHGSISIVPSLNAAHSQDESVVIQYGNINILISSIQTYWRSEMTNKPNPVIHGQRGQIRLPTIRLGSEQQQNICLLSDVLPNIEFLVTTSSRLVLHITPTTEEHAAAKTNLSMRSLVLRPTDADQVLLRQGDLDVEGIDRILDGMGGDDRVAKSSLMGMEKSSSLEHDNSDVDMGISTTTRSAKPVLMNTRSGRKHTVFT